MAACTRPEHGLGGRVRVREWAGMRCGRTGGQVGVWVGLGGEQEEKLGSDGREKKKIRVTPETIA